MKSTLINETCAAITSSYNDAFWKAMRGNNLFFADMAQAKISDTGGTYLLPAKTASRFSVALKKENLFRIHYQDNQIIILTSPRCFPTRRASTTRRSQCTVFTREAI